MSRNMRLFQPALAGGSTAEAVAADEPPPNPVLDWLALYLPSWGTSVVLHAALIVLATFVAWRTYEETRLPPPWGVALKTDRYRLERRPQGPAEVRKDRSRLALKKEPYAFSPTKLPQPRPGIGHADKPADIPVIGIGGGPRGGKNLWGDSGPGPGDGPIFEPVPDARRIVYVVDRSGSMTDSLEWYVKPELKRSIGELAEEHAFHVIFYSSGPPVEMPTRRLVEATDRNRRLAFAFIDTVVARDQTDPSEALRRAFEVRPEVIYFLTDGEFDRAIVGLVKQLNAGGHVRVHTIGFLYDGNREVLERIAADSGGWFKFVSERDLAALGR